MNRSPQTSILLVAFGSFALSGCPDPSRTYPAGTDSAADSGAGTETGTAEDTTTWSPATGEVDGTTGAGVCTPGEIESCACEGGGEGSQACMPDGSDFFPCFCGGADDGQPTGTTTGDGDDGDDADGTDDTNGTGTGGVVGSIPVAGIQHPASGEDRPVNQNIPFDGTGLDEEDGILMGPAMVWSSDLEGEIGVGANIQVPLTMLGLHEITLTVTDSDGNTGVASIFVNVVP